MKLTSAASWHTEGGDGEMPSPEGSPTLKRLKTRSLQQVVVHIKADSCAQQQRTNPKPSRFADCGQAVWESVFSTTGEIGL